MNRRPIHAAPLGSAALLGSAAPLALAVLSSIFVGCRGVREEQVFDEEAQLELYVTTATYLYEDGSLVRAQDQAVKALELDPENKAMRRMIGWIRLRQGSVEDLIIAERFFRDLLEEDDDSAATLLGLATTLERKGLGYDQAARAIAAGERPPPEGTSVEDEARLLAKKSLDAWHESLELYERTLVEGEGSTRTMNGLQRVHALLGGYEESLSWSDKLLARSTAELEDWQRMLQAEDLSEDEEALLRTNEEEATTLQVDTLLFRATLLQRLGRRDEAAEHLDRVIALRPEVAQLYSRRAQLLAELGEFQRAIEDIDHFLKLSSEPFDHPDVQRAFDLRASCEIELDKLAGG